MWYTFKSELTGSEGCGKRIGTWQRGSKRGIVLSVPYRSSDGTFWGTEEYQRHELKQVLPIKKG